MTSPGGAHGAFPVFFAKAVRVFASGLLSITIPFYLKVLGYGPFFQGLALASILAGGALSNVILTYLDASVGRRRILQGFSALMVISGTLLAVSTSAAAILAACLVGNISSTGTESGPFQSVETGILPDLAPPGAAVKLFGRYNLIGYSAAAMGQLAAAGPGVAGYSTWSFQLVFLIFAGVGATLFLVYGWLGFLEFGRSPKPGFANFTPQGKKDIVRLSWLFSMDSFGAVFVTAYILSVWFNSNFGLQLDYLGPVFFVATVVSAASTYGAAFIALRIGNLRAMVYTHITSSVFLIAMGAAGSLLPALAFLFLRQSLSQMDVPARQALMAEAFGTKERVPAYAMTNVMRNVGSLAGGPVAAAVLGLGLVGDVPFLGGATKIAYDLLTFASFRKRYR